MRPWLRVGSDAEVESDLTSKARRQAAAQSGNYSSHQAVGVQASQLQLMLIPIDLVERSRIDEHSAGDS